MIIARRVGRGDAKQIGENAGSLLRPEYNPRDLSVVGANLR